MNEDDVGQVFLLAMKWDWTYVGRFMGFRGGLLVLHQAGYFTRPAKTFELLCSEGFLLSGDGRTRFHASQDRDGEICVANEINGKWRWLADWPQPRGGD